ncbi:hypothetical conserved protein [Mycoplasma sp. CAG:472]|jgi:PRC-barrel domain|nr:YlmC/YmxH family sporulation protein [Bacilli bacterium]CDE37510.1 hypothetical conserved protein [Mycoplasma sp. CAG:472]
MSNIFLSDLQEKEIISIETGLNYGHIVDAQISSDGKIISFVAESKKIFRKPLVNNEISFTYEDIVKVGKDVILVKV